MSADADSDADELDQIATPGPTTSQSDRAVYKRKESDWKMESVSKRAKHDQLHDARDNACKGDRPRNAFSSGSVPMMFRRNSLGSASGSDSGALGDSAPRHKSSSISNKSLHSSMFPPALPSRARKEAVPKVSTPERPSSGKQPALSAQPLVAVSSASKTKPVVFSSGAKDIPSSLDSTLFSRASAKSATRSPLHRSPEIVPDPNDVIEVSSASSDTPPPSPFKRKISAAPSTPSSTQRSKKATEKRKSATHFEVIEIFDSDDEIQNLLATPISRASQSRMSIGQLGAASPSSAKLLKSSDQDHGQITSGSLQVSTPSANPPSSLTQSLPATPAIQSIGPNPLTEKVLGDLPHSAGHSRSQTGVSEEASKPASISDYGDINMRDVHVALGLTSLSSKKGKEKEVSVPKHTRTPASFSSQSILCVSDHKLYIEAFCKEIRTRLPSPSTDRTISHRQICRGYRPFGCVTN